MPGALDRLTAKDCADRDQAQFRRAGRCQLWEQSDQEKPANHNQHAYHQGSAPAAWAQQPEPGHSSISQIAVGGGWKTTLTLLNLSSTATSVTITFQSDDGLPLPFPLVVKGEEASPPLIASEVSRVVPAFATLQIEMEASPPAQTVTGWADVVRFGAFAGFAIFRQRGQDGRDSEGTAPLEVTSPPGLLLPFDNSEGFATGIALVNPGADRLPLVALVRDETGLILGHLASR